MKNQKGFTLVELMVVMAIIAILATVGITQYGKFIAKARDTVRVADMGGIEATLTSIYTSTGAYPAADKVLEKLQSESGKKFQDPSSGQSKCLTTIGTAGIDSAHNCEYEYAVCDGGGYMIRAKVEHTDTKPVDTVILPDTVTQDPGYYEVGDCANATSYPTSFVPIKYPTT